MWAETKRKRSESRMRMRVSLSRFRVRSGRFEHRTGFPVFECRIRQASPSLSLRVASFNLYPLSPRCRCLSPSLDAPKMATWLCVALVALSALVTVNAGPSNMELTKKLVELINKVAGWLCCCLCEVSPDLPPPLQAYPPHTHTLCRGSSRISQRRSARQGWMLTSRTQR